MSQSATIPENESKRLAAVRELCVLDTPPEPVFDHLTELACTLFHVPMALISLVDEHRQFFKSVVGLNVTGTPRSQSFCAYTILSEELFIIPDTQADTRFRENLLVTGHPHVRFYAGAPMRDKNGSMLGSFCVLSDHPKTGLSPAEQSSLKRFAALASEALEHRLYPAKLAEAEKSLREINERYRLAGVATQDGLWDWDLPSGEIYYSPQLRNMMGYAEEEHWADIAAWVGRLHPEDAVAAQANVQHLLRNSVPSFENEYRMRHEDGTWRWVHNRGVAVRDEAGRLIRLTGAMRDVTKERTRDSLTGLETRIALINAIDQRLAKVEEPKLAFAVLCLDLDNFKRINDSLGAGCGDSLLVEVGRRLTRAFEHHGKGVVARIVGDEFAIFADEITDAERGDTLAEELLRALKPPFSCEGRNIQLEASMGVVLYNGEPSSTTQILEQAQFAMHQAKAQGGAQSRAFSAGLQKKARLRLELETEFRSAMADNQICLHYQPKVDMVSGEIVGFEALMRWQHAEYGTVSPAEFIPLAEESDLIFEVGEWTLRKAVQQLSDWRKAGIIGNNVRMAVNLSARQFRDTQLCNKVRSTLDELRMPADCLDLEVTEGVLMHDAAHALEILQGLKAIGTRLDLDDFGTGYSSLSYLKRFPFDTLKIDRSFVHDLAENTDSPAIVQSIVALAQALRLKVIAEGVETQPQAELLIQMGCRYAQGYLFHRPLSATAITDLLMHRRSSRSRRFPQNQRLVTQPLTKATATMPKTSAPAT